MPRSRRARWHGAERKSVPTARFFMIVEESARGLDDGFAADKVHSMSDTADLGKSVMFAARSATFRTVFRCLRAIPDANSEIRELLAREEEWDAIGHWDFGSLSLQSLRVMQDLLAKIADDPVAASSDWNPEWRPVFVSDIEEFRRNLRDRIRLSEAHK